MFRVVTDCLDSLSLIFYALPVDTATSRRSSCRHVYPYDFAVIFTGKVSNYGNYGQKIILRDKKSNPPPPQVSSAIISVKRRTAKKRFLACLASYTFTKTATKRTRVPTAILKITVFFLKLQGFFSEIVQVHEIGVNRSALDNVPSDPELGV